MSPDSGVGGTGEGQITSVLIYRAIWNDNDLEPVRILDDAFSNWCTSKGVDAELIPRRGRHTVDQRRWVDVRRAEVEAGRAVRCVLNEVDPAGREWTTTATAMADSSANTFWVDLECADPSGRPPESAAPRLVRLLLEEDGSPTAFGQPLRTSARVYGPSEVDELAATIIDSARELPIAVFAPDVASEPKATITRANAAAQSLAGVAQVACFSPGGQARLNEVLPPEYHVFGGAVRLYLPAPRVDDPDDAARHRWISLRVIQTHPRRAASMLAGRLARLQLHPPVPEIWDRLGPMMRRPTDDEVAARALQITNERATRAGDDSGQNLRSEVDELTTLLAEADLLFETEVGRLKEELKQTEALVREYDRDRFDDADELEALRQEVAALRKVIASQGYNPESPEDEPIDARLLDEPETVEDAVELARLHLSRVCIPDAALKHAGELAGTAKYRVWATAIWQGLIALHQYACDQLNGKQAPGFYVWCQKTGSWPTSKLAMTESESVAANAQFRGQRTFGIDAAVEPSGSIFMEAHLKIQQGGGDNIPRLYFYDDVSGLTKQMHVGYIGPHRYVRNTKA